jgi:ADP-ribose pyrophosphatase YjhB (NUDIX family)
MYTNKYDYTRINAIKIILRNPENKVLLIQELATNEWMPLHWGLPGGKPTQNESLIETYERKVKTDIGEEVKLKGLFKIEEVIMDNRTVLMFIVVAESKNSEIVSEGEADFKWVSKDDVKSLHTNELTEFYNKDLLTEYFENPDRIVPLEVLVNPVELYKKTEDQAYKDWINSGSKK